VKNVPCLAASLLFSAAFFSAVKADDSGSPNSQTPTQVEILSLQDPDGVPLIISHPPPKQASQAEIDAARSEDQKTEANKNWLLRSYEEELRKHPGDNDNNIYYQIANDKGLSKLAGISPFSSSPDDTAAALRAGPANGKNTLSLRPDSSLSGGVNPSATSIPLFKPLITPLGSADAAGLHNFYGNQPAAPAPAPTSKSKTTDSSPISSDLDIPGQVGAESNPLTKASLTFDTLPDDVLPDKASPRAHVANDVLPLSTNAARIQKINDTALNAPGSIKTIIPSKAAELEKRYEEDFAPANLPAPSPVRRPISSPYDILDRP
jgi:hypothetical protein